MSTSKTIFNKAWQPQGPIHPAPPPPATTFRSTLLKSLSIYVLASFASPLVSLVLAPFLTHTLSRAEYGALAVLTTVIALVTGITQVGMSSAFFRAYNCDYESPADRLGVLSTVLLLLLLISVPITIVITLAAPWVSVALFNTTVSSGSVRLAALVVLLQNLTVPGLAWLRAENRATSYASLSIANLLVSLLGTIILIHTFHLGIVGSLLALGAGNALIVVCTLPTILIRIGKGASVRRSGGGVEQGELAGGEIKGPCVALRHPIRSWRPRFDIAKNLLSFGLPLVSSFVSVWVLQLSDRYLLTHFGSLVQTASYSVAYSLGGVLGALLLGPFSLAWPTVMYTIAKRADATQLFRLVFRWYFIALLFSSFGLLLIATALLKLFFPPTYQVAATLIPVIALAIMFYGLYNILSVGISIQRKTWLAFIAITLSATVNVVLNIVLIPLYGSMGAAVATLLAYILLALIVYVINQRIYPVPFEIGLFGIALVLGIALYMGDTLVETRFIASLGTQFIASQTLYISCCIDGCFLGFYGICLFLLGKRYHPISATNENQGGGREILTPLQKGFFKP